MVLPEVTFVGTLTFVGFNFLRALSQKPISKVHNGRREKESKSGKRKKVSITCSFRCTIYTYQYPVGGHLFRYLGRSNICIYIVRILIVEH